MIMLTEFERKENLEMRDKFLELRNIDIKYQYPYKKNGIPPYGYVYCIENKKNGKKYIGSTHSVYQGVNNPSMFHSLKKRATNYIYEYNSVKSNHYTTKKMDRPIIQAMVNDGIENFVMYPIAETAKETHYNIESFFIEKFDSSNPDKGYNLLTPYKYKNGKKNGVPHTELGKKLRSTEIICINHNEKKIIFADSMKLFGDYMNSSKTMIKNSVRKCRPYKGWYCFYTDFQKRDYIIKTNVLGNGLARGDRHSPESAKAMLEFHNLISIYIKKHNSELFPFYKIEELRYNV